MTQHSPESHPMTGIENFRDFGGYPLPGGRKVRSGILFRSAALHRAAPEAATAFGKAGITHVIDLRSPAEREQQPCSPVLAAIVQMIDGGTSADRTFAPDAWPEGHLYMLHQYRLFAFEAIHVAAFSRYFALLAEAPGGVLIHCAAGKDRTGLLAALTLRLLGAAEDDIKADYLLTNMRDIDSRLPRLQAMMEERRGTQVSPDFVRAMLVADAAWLDAAFESIDQKCGSLDVYFEDILGITPARRAAIHAHATVPA
jgi:protein-tyrosine phosphatase